MIMQSKSANKRACQTKVLLDPLLHEIIVLIQK